MPDNFFPSLTATTKDFDNLQDLIKELIDLDITYFSKANTDDDMARVALNYGFYLKAYHGRYEIELSDFCDDRYRNIFMFISKAENEYRITIE